MDLILRASSVSLEKIKLDSESRCGAGILRSDQISLRAALLIDRILELLGPDVIPLGGGKTYILWWRKLRNMRPLA